MSLSLEQYMGLCYATKVVPEQCTDGSMAYLATHPELDGCMAHGDTPEEALQNLAEARELYISTLLKRDLEVPMPRASTPSIVWRRFEVSRQQVTPSVPTRAIEATSVRPLTPLGASVAAG